LSHRRRGGGREREKEGEEGRRREGDTFEYCLMNPR
jgi:hypothetical protein